MNIEVARYLYRLEVRLQRAVLSTRNRDVLAVVDARVALREPGLRLDERVVLVKQEIVTLNVAADDASVVLTSLHYAVAAQNSFQVAAEICVLKHNCNVLPGKTSVSHEAPCRTTRKVRLAYGPTLDPFSRRLVVQR